MCPISFFPEIYPASLSLDLPLTKIWRDVYLQMMHVVGMQMGDLVSGSVGAWVNGWLARWVGEWLWCLVDGWVSR